MLGAFAADISWTEAEGFPYAGTYVGPESILQNVFMKLGTEWAPFFGSPGGIYFTGETVVALGQYSGMYKATGKNFTAPFAHVWNFQNGKIVRFRQFTDTVLVQKALQNG